MMKRMIVGFSLMLLCVPALFAGQKPAAGALAQSPLGAAQTFAVLAASTATNTGPTVITGDVGVSPGTAITGFPPGTVVGGALHAGDALAAQAQSDALLAYASLVGLPCGTNLSGQNLGGLTLAPGVYCFDSSAQLTGTLNLANGSGPWVFQIGSTLTTASNSSVLVNGHTDCNGSDVYWQVGSSATLGTGTQFVGNIVALASITLNTSANVSGSVIALTAAVTMDTNTIGVCGSGSGSTFPPPRGAIKVTGGGQIPVPSPDSAVPDATGVGRATFGFNAQPSDGGAKGEFNYVNHVTGLHVDGPVTGILVIGVYTDGSPKTVLISGTCRGVPSCSFIATVEDRAEPGTTDQFGITVIGGVSEVRSQRVISNGNIQFHKK